MAWYALYKWFIPWRKTPYQNMISYYKRFLYDEWFNSLSDEDKTKEERQISDLKAKRKRGGREGLDHLGQLYSMMDRMSGGRINDYMQIARDVNKMSIHPSKYW